MKFQVLSGLDIDPHQENLQKYLSETIPSNHNATLVCTGNLCKIDLWFNPESEKQHVYFIIVNYLCKNFKRVILIPGQHEYHTSNPSISYHHVNNILTTLQNNYQNLDILRNEHIIIENTLIFGSTLWTYCPHQYFKPLPIYDVDETPIDCGTYNRFHLDAISSLESSIDFALRNKLKMIVITHYLPYIDLCIDSINLKECMDASMIGRFGMNDIIDLWICDTKKDMPKRRGKILCNLYQKGQKWNNEVFSL